MFKKETLKSKTFWSGVLGVIGGVILLTQGETEKGVGAIIAGIAVMSGRDAISKIGK